MTWMLYGAYGYTGRLIADEAIKRGHKPLLVGRSKEKLAPLAGALGLDYTVVRLEDKAALEKAVAGMELVLHSAGPFIRTSDAMIRACLAAGAHYLDITGEIPAFENTFSYDQAARQKGVTLISGCGFDVVPTDCLAKYVADRIPSADTLEIAFSGLSGYSSGTALTTLESLPNGGLVRRGGRLKHYTLGQGAKRVRFLDRQRMVIPIPWGDLATAYRSTGIPNITTYAAYPRRIIGGLKYSSRFIEILFKLKPMRNLAGEYVRWIVNGPDEQKRLTGKAYAWACASNREGKSVEAWLQTVEVYQFTALAAVRCVEKTIELHSPGSLTPAQAFGPDFVLEIPGTIRKTEL